MSINLKLLKINGFCKTADHITQIRIINFGLISLPLPRPFTEISNNSENRPLYTMRNILLINNTLFSILGTWWL